MNNPPAIETLEQDLALHAPIVPAGEGMRKHEGLSKGPRVEETAVLHLQIHGIRVRVACRERSILEHLRRDFHYFVAEAPSGAPNGKSIFSEPEIRIELRLGAPAAPGPRDLALIRTTKYTAYDRGPVRRIHYRDGAVAIYDFARGEGRIDCLDPMRLHELAYLAVLSRAGEALDRRGVHRIHALGFERAGRGGLLLLPSGGGKSVMALELLRSSSMGIVAEDTPLVSREGRLHAFPLRWAFLPSADLAGVPAAMIRPFHRKRHGPKRLVDVALFRSRVRTDVPLRWLLIGERRPQSRPHIASASGSAARIALGLNLVVGWGVAQLSEYMLRLQPSGLTDLASIAASRWRTARVLLSRTSPHRFVLGPDPRENLRVLSAFTES